MTPGKLLTDEELAKIAKTVAVAKDRGVDDFWTEKIERLIAEIARLTAPVEDGDVLWATAWLETQIGGRTGIKTADLLRRLIRERDAAKEAGRREMREAAAKLADDFASEERQCAEHAKGDVRAMHNWRVQFCTGWAEKIRTLTTGEPG